VSKVLGDGESCSMVVEGEASAESGRGIGKGTGKQT
nr:hypothetical protein [Tanacetum cinerariifolium]